MSEAGEAASVKPCAELTVRAIVVDAVKLPDVPSIVIVAVPAIAVALAVRVSTQLPDVGLVANLALTPPGNPDAASVTLPVNPFTPFTVMAAVPEPPRKMVSKAGAAPRVKLGAANAVPLNAILCEAAAALRSLSVRTSVPLIEPAATGVKLILRLQLPFTGRELFASQLDDG